MPTNHYSDHYEALESGNAPAIQPEKKRTAFQTFCWGTMQTVMTAVTSRTLVDAEITGCPEKSLEALILLAFVVPLSIEYYKQMFNLTGGLRKPLRFNWKSNLAQVTSLLALALTLHYSEVYKAIPGLRKPTPVGFDAMIIVPGIAMKLISNYLESTSKQNTHEVPDTKVDSFTQPLLESEETKSANETHAPTWGNWCAMHIAARLLLLFCATNAGGQFFEAMDIPLAEGIVAAGLTGYSAIIVFSVIFNEILGSHFFLGSDIFTVVHPNLIPRLVTMFGLALTFQLSNIMTEPRPEYFIAAYLTAFTVDLAVDTAVEKLGIREGMSKLLSKGYERAVQTVTDCSSSHAYAKLGQHSLP